jgi:DNA transformation protein
MDAEGLKALFEPFGSVTVRRMFGGSGIYAEGLCFAIELKGEVFLKTDPLSQAHFSAAGSTPFIYVAKGKSRPTSFWRLPDAAHEDADELRRWAKIGLEAARRAAEAKAKPRGSRRRAGRAERSQNSSRPHGAGPRLFPTK